MTRVSLFLAWGDFHESSRFPEEKWGTTRSLHHSIITMDFEKVTEKCVWRGAERGKSALEYTGNLNDLKDRLPSKPHYQYENPISHLFPLFSSYKSSGEDLSNYQLNFIMCEHVLNSHHHF